jgi:mitotic-spindle organizing protein 1
MDNNSNNFNHLDVEETRETVESNYLYNILLVLYELSQILNCGINRDTLSVLISMIENGVNPEALAAVVKEMNKENLSLNNNESVFVIY